MKKIVILSLLVILALGACSPAPQTVIIRGSGTIAGEDREIHGVNGVTLATGGDLTVTLGREESLRIEAEDNLLPYIETRTWSGMLTIRQKEQTQLNPTKPIRFYLTVKALDHVAVSSSGNIEAPAVATGQFTATVNSSGNIHLAGLVADQLAVEINSSGGVRIDAGLVGAQTVNINSSGDYAAGDVRSTAADVRINSSGDATIWVTERLNAILNSSGNVEYYGRPSVTETLNSSGRTVSLGEKEQ
jgi:hypothetical protein